VGTLTLGLKIRKIKYLLQNRFKRKFPRINKRDQKYLFILSPPFCGSTLLNKIISTSGSVSVNNNKGTREGQKLPGVRPIMFDHKRRWDETLDFDWPYIKKVWRKNWDVNATILLEKSPPNILRAKSLEEHFQPAYFIVLYRNPFAHCESLMRRRKTSLEESAQFAIKCLKFQKQNIEQLDRNIQVAYEALSETPVKTLRQIQMFLPELSDMKLDDFYDVHNFKNKPLEMTNLNQEKISRFTSREIDELNRIFKLELDLLGFFGYKLL